ncbi:MAG: hypothetical protein QXJ94_00800 [Candidatus Bathyarchaeia archaeon]
MNTSKTFRSLNIEKIIGYTLFAFGITAIVISIICNSQISAFTGLGLTFWGVILTYIKKENIVNEPLLTSSVVSPLEIIDQIIQEMKYTAKAVYLPPKYFRNPETCKAYIPKYGVEILPTPEQIQKQENKLFINNTEGLLIQPPGAALVKLFESTLKTSFNKTDLIYVEQNLPKLFIEELEIAENMEIQIKNEIIYLKIESSIYKNLIKQVSTLAAVYNSLGCPLSSAIACVLAKASGKLLVIESQQISEDGAEITILFRFLKQEPPEP